MDAETVQKENTFGVKSAAEVIAEIGFVEGLPSDLSTNPKYMEGFGRGKIELEAGGNKMPKTLTMDEVKARTIEELLQEVDDTQEPVRVVLTKGHEIDITPAPKLKPMIRLEGYIPDGWKDAIYSQE